MKQTLLSLLVLATTASSAWAVQITKEQLPPKVMAHFNKKHPVTSNLVFEEKQHFGQKLYEISFHEERTDRVLDDDEQKFKQVKTQVEGSVFYRKNGSFFVSAEKLYSFNVIPGVALEGLKKAFPDYKITAAKVIINPNGAGEEYEVTITSGGNSWDISLGGKGAIISQEKAIAQASTAPAPAVPATPAAAPAAPATPATPAAAPATPEKTK